jgi:hypothetical protein
MATLFPDLNDDYLSQNPSKAEVKIYRAFRDKLPKDWIVFYQVQWLLKNQEEIA